MTSLFLTLALAFMSYSNQPNPNSNDRQLLALMSENVSTRQSQSSIPVSQAGAKSRQIRDMSATPSRIDIVKGIENQRNVTLSQVASDIEYINIGAHRFKPNVQMTSQGLIVSNIDGVWLYSYEGKMIKQIYKNQHDGVFGAVGYIMEKPVTGVTDVYFDEKEERLWVHYKKENDIHMTRFGYLDLAKNRIQLVSSEKKQDSVKVLASFEAISGQINYLKDFIVYRNNKLSSHKTFATCSFQGDTLCNFTFGYDSITAKATDGIGVDYGNYYIYRGLYTFRNSFNDTLFRVTDANKYIAEYVLDVGTSGRATNKGNISDVHIDQMYIIQSIREDDRYLYILFSKNYDCPANRENGKVRFWWGLVDKTTKAFFTLPFVSDSDPDTKGFENDLDGGLPFWPKQTGEHGEKIAQTKGIYMKEQLTASWFSNSKALNPQKKEKLAQFVKTLKDDDIVIIIVK